MAELKVACDLVERGYQVAIPFGEDCDFDLILVRENDRLERIQVKYTRSNGAVVTVRCRSHSLTNGKVKRTKHYTDKSVDWIAVYDSTSERCYYVPAGELGEGRFELTLRLTPALNNQRMGVRFASDYVSVAQGPRDGERLAFG